MHRHQASIVTLAGLLQAAALVHAEPAIPIPGGSSALSESSQVEIGSATLNVQGFSTTMDLASLQAFYEQALPKAGWRIEPLPWQAHQARVTTIFEQAAKKDPVAAQDPKLQAALEQAQATRAALRHELYASHQGGEHVILHFMPLGERQMGVFINRWTGQTEWMAPESGAMSSPMAAWLGQSNVCCSGEEIPNSQGSLPFGLPRYPGAKLLSKSTPRSGASASVLLMTPDAVEAVAAFYQQQMAYNRWEVFSIGEPEAAGASLQVLMYRNATHLCGLTMQAGGQAGQTLITITVMPRPTLTGTAQP